MRRRGAALAAVLLAALCLLAACSNPNRVTVYGAPPDPPPLAPRKPPLAEQPRLAGQPRLAEEPRLATAPVRGELPGAHRVAAGETLYGVSRLYNVPLRAIIDANRLEPPYTLAVGQRLTIPRPRLHQVAAGETVYGISRSYGVDMATLMQLNDIRPPYAIAVGQKLLLPSSGETGGEAPRQTAAVEPSRPAAQDTAVATLPPAGDANQAPQRAKPAAKQSAAIPQPPARSSGKFLWPLRGKILSRYGPQGDGRHNDGVNIAAPLGTPVLASENGVIAYAGNELRGFGNLLLVKHDGGWITAYAHNSELLVRRGDTVRRGQPIARVGSSGSVPTPQLHFEIRKGTRALDPLDYLERVTAGG